MDLGVGILGIVDSINRIPVSVVYFFVKFVYILGTIVPFKNGYRVMFQFWCLSDVENWQVVRDVQC